MNRKYKKLIFLSMAIIHCGCSSPSTVKPSQPNTSSVQPSPTSPQTKSQKKETSLDKEQILKNEEAAITVSISITKDNKKEIVGSGVIIGHKKNTLYILTAQHNIGVGPDDDTSPFIITTDRGDFTLNRSNFSVIVKQLSDLDLAVLSFPDNTEERSQNELAHLNQVVQAKTVAYLFGYLPCVQTSPNRKQQLSSGKITQFQPEGKSEEFKDIYYDMNTVKGLSGSPIFDRNGNLIAIHTQGGQRKSDYDSNQCASLPSKPDKEYTGNSGISIKEFFNLKQQWPPGLEEAIQTTPTKNNKPVAPAPVPRSTDVESSEENCGAFREQGETCSKDEK
jgi:S1-C subfamily serine protease